MYTQMKEAPHDTLYLLAFLNEVQLPTALKANLRKLDNNVHDCLQAATY